MTDTIFKTGSSHPPSSQKPLPPQLCLSDNWHKIKNPRVHFLIRTNYSVYLAIPRHQNSNPASHRFVFLAHRHMAITLYFAAAILLALVGCAKPSPLAGSESAPTSLRNLAAGPGYENAYSYDVGTVISGDRVSHMFDYANLSNEAISIQDELDIKRNCGCTSLMPERRHLEPGQATAILVEVDTHTLIGAFAHGGQLVWTSSTGKKRPVRLSIHGNAVSAFIAEPSSLLFDCSAVSSSLCRDLRLTSNLPIDWSTLTLSGSSDSFEITESVIEGNGARFKVRCRLPDDVEISEDSLIASGCLLTNGNSTIVPGKQASVVVPVRATQTITLQISPKVAIFTSLKPRSATATLLLRGQMVTRTASLIDSITSPWCNVAWQLQSLPESNAAILALTLTGPTTPDREREHYLTIQLTEGGSLRVPYVLVDHLK